MNWIIKQAELEMRYWEESFINTIYISQYHYSTGSRKAANWPYFDHLNRYQQYLSNQTQQPYIYCYF